jgi:DnaK suppressor protein
MASSPRPGLTKTQLEALRRRLEDERRRILRVLEAPDALVSPDEERSEFEESAQRATERAEQITIAERERALLVEVDRALARLGAGTYGLDEASGEPIPYERLIAIPWARVGVDE